MTGTTALPDVARAVYGALTGNVALMALLKGGVADHDPVDPVLPFAYLGAFEETQDDTSGLQVRSVTFIATIWSSYAGMSEVYSVLDAMAAVLHRAPLTVTGWTWEATTFTGAKQGDPVDIDGLVVQHVDAMFTVQVTEA